MSGPTVDVIIPTRNRPRLTLDAIRCVRTQTLRGWHLFVVDDASDDGSVEFIRRGIAGDANIELIVRSEQGGPQAARQTGFEASEGGFVAILDSDDLWEPTKLARQLAAFEDEAGTVDELGAVLCWHRWADVNGSPHGPVKKPQAHGRAGPLVSNNMSTIMLTRAALVAAGGFLPVGTRPLFTCEGIEFYMRLTERCEFTVVPELLVTCRDHREGKRANAHFLDRRAAEELEYILQVHATLLAAYPAELARLRGRVAARYLAAGSRREGLAQLLSAMRHAPTGERTRLARSYGPFALKAMITRPNPRREIRQGAPPAAGL